MALWRYLRGVLAFILLVSFVPAEVIFADNTSLPRSVTTDALPDWFSMVSTEDVPKLLPAWYVSNVGGSSFAKSNKSFLPVKSTVGGFVKNALPSLHEVDNSLAPNASVCPLPSNRAFEVPLHRDSVTQVVRDSVLVSGPTAINNCDTVTFTVVITNSTTPVTGVRITTTMPSVGYSPAQQIFNVGAMAAGEVVTLYAVYQASCDSVSGQHATTIAQDGVAPFVIYNDFVLNPGAITLRKEPAIIEAQLEDVVTWTVTVENSGYGDVYNVEVTDTLDSGLSYVSGLTHTYIPSIPVGRVYTFPVSAEVVGCSKLQNSVTATWGCGSEHCLLPQIARGAIDFNLLHPRLIYTLTTFDIPYCSGTKVFTVPVKNIGDGVAYSATLGTDISPFSVTVGGDASYNASGFFIPRIDPGQTYDLVFTLTLPSDVCALSSSGSFEFTLDYYDRCKNLYVELPDATNWVFTGGPGSVSVSKTMPREASLGETVRASITVDASDVSGSIVVTDALPAGWTVVEPDGGDTSIDGFIIWTLTQSTVLTPLLRLPTPLPTDTSACDSCGQSFVNVVTATAQDCQGCRDTATASALIYIECEEGLTGDKVVSHPLSPCSDDAFTYTNTYTFGPTFSVTPTWQGLIFTETLGATQSYITGTAKITVSDGIACSAVFSESLIGSELVISNISPTCGITVPGSTLQIIYRTSITETQACGEFSYFDWSYFDLGVTGNGLCSADGRLEQGTFISTESPQMSMSVSSLPAYVSTCGEYTVTLTARRSITRGPAYDVSLTMVTNTFAVVDVIGFGGAAPVLTTSDASGYFWQYGDVFTSAITGTITLRVQLRCGQDAPFTAILDYGNQCVDKGISTNFCQAGGTLGDPLVVPCLPIMTKFPELIYATGDIVTWTLTAYNSGSGVAYGVTLTDVLGSGLRYMTSTITSTRGSAAAVASVVPLTSSNWVTWHIASIYPKEKVFIEYQAEIIGCDDLTNNIYGKQGCLGEVCQSGCSKEAYVELPGTVLLNTNQFLNPLQTCYSRTVTATIRNAGLLSVYSATVNELLPPGLSYVAGSTVISRADQIAWQPGTEPDITLEGVGMNQYQRLVWGPDSGGFLGDWLKRVHPKETVYIRFNMQGTCTADDSQLQVRTGYYDTCGNPHETAASSYLVQVLTPELEVIKTGVNLSRTSAAPDLVYGEPGEPVIWTITVTNESDASPAPLVVLTDILPVNLFFVDASTPPAYTTDSVASSGGRVIWDLGTVTPGATLVFTVGTVITQPEGCTVLDTENRVRLTWGCPDGCRLEERAEASLRSRPVYLPPTLVTPFLGDTLNQCGGLMTVTLNNEGPPAYNVAFTDTLPNGFVYSETVFASVAPVTYPVSGAAEPVWHWTNGVTLPTGVMTLVFEVRNSLGAGLTCAIPSGDNLISLRYDDYITGCFTTSSYFISITNAINIVQPDLVVTKLPDNATGDVGDVISWTLRVENIGAGVAYNMVVTDAAQSNYTNITASVGSDGILPTKVGNVITWSPDPIPPGGVWTAVVSATLLASGDNTNLVTATASCGTGCVSAQAVAVAYTTLLEEFHKWPPVQTGTIGSLTVFTFSVSLSDRDALYTDLVLTDVLPLGLQYLSSVLTYTYDGPTWVGPFISTTPTSLINNNVVWRLGDLHGVVRVRGILTAVVRNIPSNYEGFTLTNEAQLSYIDDGQPYIYTDTVEIGVLEPILHLGKSYITGDGCGATLFVDNFNGGSGWASNNGWSVSGGVFQQTTNNSRQLYRGDTGWSDYSFSTMVRAAASDLQMGLYFRHQDNNNYYWLYWRRSDGRLIVQRRVAGSNTNTTTGHYYVPGQWHHVEVRGTGPLVEVYVDGALVYTDLSAAVLSGRIGVYSRYASLDAPVSFDDVLVTRMGDMGCLVGSGSQVSYTLVVSNQGRLPGYDLVITDALPPMLSLVTYTLSTNDATSPTVTTEPAPIPGATGVITWGVDHLDPIVPFAPDVHTALTLTVVLQVSDAVTANTVLANRAELSYDNWITSTQPTTITRDYSGGSHSTAIRTVDGGLTKLVAFDPPPTATLGTLVTYTLIIPAPPITATLYNVVVTDVLDSRMRIETVDLVGGTGGAVTFDVPTGIVTATFDSILHSTQAYVTVTARISHTWPDAGGDANSGDILINTATMTHSAATEITSTNEVSTVVGEPLLDVQKVVTSSVAALRSQDGTAYLTYTIRVTNSGNSPAYSVYITDRVPSGISVTAQYGGDARGGPVKGPDVMTWFIRTISNVVPYNAVALSYTARITQSLNGVGLTNTVQLSGHSLTDTIPGIRPYTDTTTATIETRSSTLLKVSEPPTLRIGDWITYHLVFTIPAGTVGLGGPDSYLHDVLPPGVWYITDTERITWTPGAVSVVPPTRITGTLSSSQVVTWTFNTPVTSLQELPTVITLMFNAQVTGLRIDDRTPLFPDNTAIYVVNNVVSLWDRGEYVDSDDVDNSVFQPSLTIDKDSTPPSGSYVGAGDLITYTLTIVNDGRGPAYDILISDTLSSGLIYVDSGITSTAPSTIAFTSPPISVGATGTLVWSINTLWGRDWNSGLPATAVITVVARVTDTIGASARLTNTAAITNYDSQPDDGPGPWDERDYPGEEDEVWHQTPAPYGLKEVVPLTATIGDVVVFMLEGPFINSTLYNVWVTDSVDSRLTVTESLAIGSGAPPIDSDFVGNVVTGTWGTVPALSYAALIITTTVGDPTTAVAGEQITNTATFRFRTIPSGPDIITGLNTVTVTIVEPDLFLVKGSDPPTSNTVGAGDLVTYTVQITNASGRYVSPAYDVIVTDTLPSGMRVTAPVSLVVLLDGGAVAASDYLATYNSGTGYYVITFTPAFSIPVGGELHITYVARVDDVVPAGIDLPNNAEVVWSSLPGPVSGDRDYGPVDDSTEVHVGFPDIALDKRVVMTDLLHAGEELTYTIYVTNTGIVSAKGVVVTDTVPVSTTVVRTTLPVIGPSNGVITWPLGILNVSETRALTMVVAVDAAVTTGTLIVNSAWVTTSEGLTDTDTVTTPVGNHVDLVIRKTAIPSTVVPGTTLTYTLAYTSLGPSDAQHVDITDTLPAEVTFGGVVRVEPPMYGPTQTGRLLWWYTPTLRPGDSGAIVFTVTVPPSVTGVLTNHVMITTVTPPEDNTDDNEDDVHTPTEPRADVVIAKYDFPDPVTAGTALTYTLAYTNYGPSDARDVCLTDTLPPGVSFENGIVAQPPGWDGPTVTVGLPLTLEWCRDFLTAGVSGQFVFTVTVLPDALGVLTNTVVITTSTPDDISSNNDDDEETTLTTTMNLQVQKYVTPTLAVMGNILTYTVIYTNQGPSDAQAVTVGDQLPDGVMFITGSSSTRPPLFGPTQTGRLLWWYTPTVHAGVTGTILFNVRVMSDALQILTNTVAITSTTIETSTQDNDDDVQLPLLRLYVSKRVSKSPVLLGEMVSFTLWVTNTGGLTLTTVPVTDTYDPVYLEFVTSTPPAGNPVPGLLTWANIGPLVPSQQERLVITFTTLATTTPGVGSINWVTTTSTVSDTILPPVDDSDTVTIGTPILSVVKTSISTGGPPVYPGERLTYTLVVRNDGALNATGVVISDTLPEHTEFVTGSVVLTPPSAGGILGPPPVLARDVTVAANSGVTLMYAVILQEPLTATLITNTVIVTSTEITTPSWDTITDTVLHLDLVIEKLALPNPVVAGATLTYTLAYTNYGPSDAQPLTIVDTLPPSVTFGGVVYESPPLNGPLQDGQQLLWFTPTFMAGESGQVVFTVTVHPDAMGSLTNTVVITTTIPDDDPDDNDDDTVTEVLTPSLELSKSVSVGRVVPQVAFTYTIQVTNTGVVTFSPLALQDTLPPDFNYVLGSGVPRDPDLIAEPLLIWDDLGPLVPGQSLTVAFEVSVTAGVSVGLYTNVAVVTGTTPGGLITDTDDSVVVLDDPSVAIDKSLVGYDTDDEAPNYITFSIAISNTGPSIIDILPLLDSYDPALISFVGATPYPDEDDDDGLLNWYDLTSPPPNGFGRNLGLGEIFSITTVFSIVQPITPPLSIVNVVTVTDAEDVNDNPSEDDSDTVTLTDTIPTAVDLLYFRAVPALESVELQWATAVEVDNYGFRLLRATVPLDTRASEIAFIPTKCLGNLCSAAYVYVDSDVLPNQDYWYWLLDIDRAGRISRHGPIRGALGGSLKDSYCVYLPLLIKDR